MSKILLNTIRIITLAMLFTAMVNSASAAITVAHTTFTNALTATSTDMFWTTSRQSHNGMYYTEIMRTGKENENVPGDVVLRQEKNTPVTFKSLVHAEVAGIPYIYFVVNFDDKQISYINRLPVNGGPVTSVTRPLYMGNNDLKTDNSFLFWADREAIRRIPIDGGTSTILARVPQNVTNKQVALDNDFVYYSSGASGESIYRVLKTGGVATFLANATSTITDLQVNQVGADSTVYWSEFNGSVKGLKTSTRVITEYHPSTFNRKATSIAFDGERILWTECTRDALSKDCRINEHQNGRTIELDPGTADNRNYGNIVAETSQVFWSKDYSLRKYVHPAPLTVSISPAPVYKQGSFRAGVNSVSETVDAIVSGGDRIPEERHAGGPYRYLWSVSPEWFTVHYPTSQTTSIFAAMPDGETRDGTLTLTVTDDLGRTATVSTSILFENPLDIPGHPRP